MGGQEDPTMLRLDPADIAPLSVPVAMYGAIQSGDLASDEIFDMLVAVVVIVYGG
jgi:hypothetical protein